MAQSGGSATFHLPAKLELQTYVPAWFIEADAARPPRACVLLSVEPQEREMYDRDVEGPLRDAGFAIVDIHRCTIERPGL